MRPIPDCRTNHKLLVPCDGRAGRSARAWAAPPAPEEARMKDVTRYHPLLVLLHWVLAFLIGGALLFGAVVLAPMSSVNPAKMEGLRTHMGAGLAILTLMGVRLAVRRRTSHPPAASAGSPVLDRLARLSHQALYIAIFAQAISGLIMALQARLPQIVF